MKPSQPRALEPNWKPPTPGKGSPVWIYLVFRRDKDAGGELGKWNQADVALRDIIMHINQPRFTHLEYCIVAVNAGGVSMPSNTAAVVV